MAKLNDEFLDEFGREIPDPTPLEEPLTRRKLQTGMSPDYIRQLVAQEISRLAEEEGLETLQESDDFEMDDDDDKFSPYELQEMQQEPLPEPQESGDLSPEPEVDNEQGEASEIKPQADE